MSIMRPAIRPVVAGVVLATAFGCGETVVTTSSHQGGGAATTAAGGAGSGTATGTPAGNAGGAGGQQPVCGQACIECCNAPECPHERPEVGDACAAPLDCGYIVDGCVDHWFCSSNDPDPDSWSMTVGSLDGHLECPGACPPNWSDNGSFDVLCLEPGMTCHYQIIIEGEDKGCSSWTCEADHHWSGPVDAGDTCP